MRILLAVSGGDAPGINAAIWHIARRAAAAGDTILGARGGLPAVLNGDIIEITPNMALPFAALPGSLLPSSRDPVLARADAQAVFTAAIAQRQIDALILFGGNGTLRYILPLMEAWGVPCVGIPTTIDNDVPGTDYTLGFDSACNFAYHAIDGARATANALPGRIFTVETLGGDSGYLALAVAHGAGADAVLLPEYEYKDEWLGARLEGAVKRDGYALLVLSEGVKAARTLVDDIPKWTAIRVRDIRLGHAQRGGTPTHTDRVMAANMGDLAFRLLKEDFGVGVLIVRRGIVEIHAGTLEKMDRLLPNRALYDRINAL
ncbi:MAG: 6-phosphofructokinase [Chloroflexota bacterium]|nr:6-phosphofructokinase [Chloroflexota bacterium]